MNQTVDLLPGLQTERYIQGLLAVAHSDGLDPAELDFIQTQAGFLGVDFETIAASQPSLKGIGIGCSAVTRRLILRDCVMLAHADGVFTNEERATLVTLCGELDLDPDLIDRFNEWLQRYDAVLTEGRTLLEDS